MLTYEYWKNVKYKDNPEALEKELNAPWDSGTILIGFPDNNSLGCRFKCPFCFLNKMNYNLPIYSKDEDIVEFIHRYNQSDSPVRICGIGDVLYNFEKHKDEVKHVNDVIASTGLKSQLTTKEIDVVDKYFDSEYLQNIISYSLSVEVCNEKIRNTVYKLLKAGKFVRITKVLNFTSNVNDIDIESLKKFIEYYSFPDVRGKITFRTNYHHPLTADELISIRKSLKSYIRSNNLNVFLGINGPGPFAGYHLAGSEIISCGDIDDFCLYTLGKTRKDYSEFLSE